MYSIAIQTHYMYCTFGTPFTATLQLAQAAHWIIRYLKYCSSRHTPVQKNRTRQKPVLRMANSASELPQPSQARTTASLSAFRISRVAWAAAASCESKHTRDKDKDKDTDTDTDTDKDKDKDTPLQSRPPQLACTDSSS